MKHFDLFFFLCPIFYPLHKSKDQDWEKWTDFLFNIHSTLTLKVFIKCLLYTIK